MVRERIRSAISGWAALAVFLPLLIVSVYQFVQAAHHAPQLQLYGRGLATATGLRIRERLVLFTALGRTVQV